MSSASVPFVSVIIPVFNDFDDLVRCLMALERQTYPADCYEVWVVDNGSAQDVAPVVAPFPHVQAEREPQKGSYAARNRAIALARGTILAFTDADCIPQPDWLQRGVEHLTQTPNLGMLAGRVETVVDDPQQPTPVELYDLVFAFNQAAYIQTYKFGVTANLFAWKHTFDTVGSFDATLQSGGDYEWGWRVHQAGLLQGYAEAACVAHPARKTFADLRQKNIRLMQGHHRLMKKGVYPAKRFVVAALADILLPFRSLVTVLAHPKLKTHRQRMQVLWVMLRIRWIRGRERLRYLLQDGLG